MKKVGIDMRLYSQTGVGVYLRNLLHELIPILPQDTQFYLYVLPEDSAKIPEDPHITVKKAPYRWHTVSEQAGFLNEINRDSLDLMHFTYFGYPMFYKRNFIATVHDITPLLFQTGKASTKNPLLYQFKYTVFQLILKTQIKNAAAIITPTRTVKQQLEETFGLPTANKITPVYEGVNFELVSSREDISLYHRYTKPYLLYVGNFYPHKNLERLVNAYREINTNVPLLLVGPDDFFAKRLKEILKGFEHRPNIHFFHQPSVDQLHFFYKHAIAFVHPTLSEGFGLPLVEAAYFNVPVIASDIPVVRELLGSSYIPFDPYSTDDIAAKINGFIADPATPDYRPIMPNFSFSKMAKATLDLYLKHL